MARKLTAKQVECYLTSKNPEVRWAWAKRLDYTPTPEQIERGLTDEDRWVRVAWAERMDYTPTPEQIERGFQLFVKYLPIVARLYTL